MCCVSACKGSAWLTKEIQQQRGSGRVLMRACCCRVTNSVTQDVDTDSIRLRLSVPEANVVPQLTSLLHSTGKPLLSTPPSM